MTTRWGLTVPLAGIPLAAHEPVFREAEALGYTDFWSAESDVDPWIVLALGAAWTTRATLGTAIVGAFTRGPAIIAIGAAAMGEAAPGRFVLGLGSGSNVTVERWNGGRFERPLTRVTEVLTAVRQALDGEAMAVQGESLRVSGFKLGRPAPSRVPIYVAALQERMVRQAVRIADGVITNWLSADDVAQVAAVVRDEARKVGKDPATYPIVCRISVCPTLESGSASGSEARAREQFRRAVTAYLNVPVYRRFHEWLGRGPALAEMNAKWAEQCRETLRRYVANGVTVPVLNFMNLETDPAARAEESRAFLKALAPGPSSS